MASKIKDYPVDKDGNMSEYYEHEVSLGNHVPMHREAIVEFEETMVFQTIIQGRSKLRAILKDSKGRQWSLFSNSMDEFFKHSVKGILKGIYIVGKRGANYGLILVAPL